MTKYGFGLFKAESIIGEENACPVRCIDTDIYNHFDAFVKNILPYSNREKIPCIAIFLDNYSTSL